MLFALYTFAKVFSFLFWKWSIDFIEQMFISIEKRVLTTEKPLSAATTTIVNNYNIIRPNGKLLSILPFYLIPMQKHQFV